MTNKKLHLKALSCVDCANKILRDVKALAGIRRAELNFSNSTLSIEINGDGEWENIHSTILNIIKSYEPNVIVTEASGSLTHGSHGNKGSFFKDRGFTLFGLVLLIIGLASPIKQPLEIILYTLSYLLIGGPILLRAGRNILRGQVFDENFLMSLATLGAFAIGEYPEAVAVMLFYQIGEFFQGRAVDNSRRSIRELMDIRPDYANLIRGEDVIEVHPGEASIGDIILIKPGEKAPLDGRVLEGRSMVDTSALTGESLPREIKTGDELLSGSININGLLKVRVAKTFGESTLSKILELVEQAGSNKAPTEQFITKFSRYYTPIVVFSALVLAMLPPLLIRGEVFSQWIYRALVFLVISCPCALVISIPLGFFGGIGAASKNGILVKGGNYLEGLNQIQTMVFDKTGTLTKGVFQVVQINTHGGYTEDSLLKFAAHGEYYSNHPIALSIIHRYNGSINQDDIKDYKELPGLGIQVMIQEKNTLLGNSRLLEGEGFRLPQVEEQGTIVHVAIDQKYAGYLVIADELKDDAQKTIEGLRNHGIKSIMLTGDRQRVGEAVAQQLGLDEHYAELLPQDKVRILEDIQSQGRTDKKTVFVGDGINDAPVLARADIGIAMGGLGSDAAIEAADIVLMTDEPSKILSALKIAKRTKGIVIQNIILALSVKGFVLLLGALGMATMWAAVFADVGVSLIAVLNSLRVLKG